MSKLIGNQQPHAFAISLNGGLTEGTSLFTYDGTNAKSIIITPQSIGAALTSHGTHVSYGTSTTALTSGGTGAPGTSSNVSRSDHTHTLPAYPTVLPNPSSLMYKLGTGTETAYDGSNPKTLYITPAAIGAAATTHTHTTYLSLTGGTITGSLGISSDSSATGVNSIAQGYHALSSGKSSSALGSETTASGEYSHAEGNITVAAGDASHAEGYGKSGGMIGAFGDYSHVEGQITTTGASAIGAHAEGYNTMVQAPYAHSEGCGTLTTSGGIDTYNNGTAYGYASHVEGYKNIAGVSGTNTENLAGTGAHAEGMNTKAIGKGSHSEGYSTEARAPYSHAEGNVTLTSEESAHAEGARTTASAIASHAEGASTIASAYGAHAEGSWTTASGMYSHAEGNYTTASGKNSHAAGYHAVSLNNQYVIGHHNLSDTSTPGLDTGTTGDAFIIGNGTAGVTANAFRVKYDGTVYQKGASVTTGADYAEYFEWEDKNTENEDRVGYFVTYSDGLKIRIANAEDNYILGVVSGQPAVIGNGDESWVGMYMKDEFDRFITCEIEEEDPSTGEIKKYTTFKVNPDYDPQKDYDARSDRPEWEAIGMVGVLSVWDDETCEVNGYCKCTNGGIATKADTYEFGTYRVIQRVSKNIIKIVLK